MAKKTVKIKKPSVKKATAKNPMVDTPDGVSMFSAAHPQPNNLFDDLKMFISDHDRSVTNLKVRHEEEKGELVGNSVALTTFFWCVVFALWEMLK